MDRQPKKYFAVNNNVISLFIIHHNRLPINMDDVPHEGLRYSTTTKNKIPDDNDTTTTKNNCEAKPSNAGISQGGFEAYELGSLEVH